MCDGWINVLGALPGIERTVMLATCHEHEPLAETVADLLEQTDPRIVVRVDATFPQVMRSLSVAAPHNHLVGDGDPIAGSPEPLGTEWPTPPHR